jgi:NADH:ubiquinone oxidoreductase subunit 5 (subunit L)/multisubunit Na+/H+ antiporter MnhA subunit
MPFTCWTFLVGVLAIAGAGIPWTSLGIGGFYSKDEILATALMRTDYWPPQPSEAHDAHHAAAPTADGTAFRLVSGSTQDPHGQEPGAHAREGGAQDTDHRQATQTPGDEAHARAAPLPIGEESQHPGAVRHINQAAVAARAADTRTLPRLMLWLPILIAYVTPFYMMRCWWLTFMGKPRDEHVYKHAHESPLMYAPLVVLAVGTFLAGWVVFRPMIAQAAPAATDATLIVGVDGHAHEPAHAAGLYMPHDVHAVLPWYVGFAFLVGFAGAWLIYRRGLTLAAQLAGMPVLGWFHRLLVQKIYFDHVYNFVLVRGCIGFAWLCRLFDTYVIDLICNLSAWFVERCSAFSGKILDNEGVDGVVNGTADSMIKLGNLVRQPQTGRIRNYVLFAAGTAAVILLGVLIGIGR